MRNKRIARLAKRPTGRAKVPRRRPGAPLAPMLARLVALVPALALVGDLFVDQASPGCPASSSGGAADPFCTIGAAIAAAAPGDTIHIAPGTYVENLVVDRDLTLVGTAGAAATIVDGSKSGSVVTIQSDVTAALVGLTLTNGDSQEGGGLTSTGTVALTNSTVSGNRAVLGGGIYCAFGQPTVLTLTSSTVEDNYAIYNGGGVYANSATLTLDQSVVAANESGFRGGGVHMRWGNATITSSTIADNSASQGGGIYSFISSVSLSSSTVRGNASSYAYGGGFLGFAGDLTVESSTISENHGAGIATGGDTVLSNSTLSANSPGGGISAVVDTAGGTVTLTSCTVTANEGYGYGGIANGDLTVLLGNTVVAGNTDLAANGSGPDVAGNFVSQGNNLIGNATGSTGFANGVAGDLVGSAQSPLDAKLGPLADNGGPTQTHALQAGSPAVDAGNDTTCPPTDQRGVARPQGKACDIGSFELEAPGVAPTTPEDQKITPSDGDAGDSFGSSVAIDAGRALLGAPNDEPAGSFSGSAYVFERDGAGLFQQTAKLVAADAAASDRFGTAVALRGDTALVGAFSGDGATSDSGSVYAFARNAAGGFVQTQELAAGDGASGDSFGSALDLDVDGGTALVGARAQKGSTGAAYVFERNAAALFQQTQKLLALDAATGDQLGNAVALSGNVALLGARGDADAGTFTGSAYVFERSGPGAPFVQVQKLTASDAAKLDFFGSDVALHADLAVVGARGESANTGAVYVFQRPAPGAAFAQVQKLVPSDASELDSFGGAVALFGARLLATSQGDDPSGPFSGSAYVFERDGAGLFSQVAKLAASDGAAFDEFGGSVALSADTGLVGASQHDALGGDSGAGYFFPFVDAGGGGAICISPTPGETIVVSRGELVQFDLMVGGSPATILGAREEKAPLQGAGCGDSTPVPLSFGVSVTPLPAAGDSAVATLTWTPIFGQEGCHAFVFDVEAGGVLSQCRVEVRVEPLIECFLLLGGTPIDWPIPFSPSDSLALYPNFIFPVTGPADCPVFAIPDDPVLLGFHIYAQVYMDNAELFPDDRYKVSNGLDVVLGLGAASYAKSTGMTLFLEKAPALGGAFDVGFSID